MKFSEPIFRSVCWAASRLFYGSDKQADWIYEKMHRPGTYFRETMNILYFLTKRPAVFQPIALVLEPVYGCNLRCTYCWGNFGPEFTGQRPQFMSWEIFQKAVDQSPPSVETVSLGFLGETLMHPRIHEMIDYIAARGLRPTLFSNCTLLKGEVLERLARSRLAVLNVSVEPDIETAARFRGVDLLELRENVKRFLALKRPETEVKLSLVAHPGNVDKIAKGGEEWKGLIQRTKLSPIISRDGSRTTRTCIEPWRGSISVLTSGQVSPCCLDIYSGVMIGDLANQSLADIIRGPAFRDLLQRFVKGDLPETCKHCAEFKAPGVPRRVPIKPG